MVSENIFKRDTQGIILSTNQDNTTIIVFKIHLYHFVNNFLHYLRLVFEMLCCFFIYFFPLNNIIKYLLINFKLDDVVPDDETHWQDRVSSGFDRLVAFASTELDKTRRAMDNDTIILPSASCNTSPDSGIAHSSNSENARTFLSNSSSSSQIELSTCLVENVSTNIQTVPLGKASLTPDEAIGSPPLSDNGIPRTPSPSVSNIVVKPSENLTATISIPLKYQRKSSEKHYKKKFRERNWEYDSSVFEDTSSCSQTKSNDHNISENTNNQLKTIPFTEQPQISNHKASKFRPKGKDWTKKKDESTNGLA